MNEEEKNPVLRYAVILITVILSGVILFSLVPNFIDSTISTTIEENEGSGPLKFSYYNRSVGYDIDISVDEDSIDVGGSVPQSIPIEDTLVYSDSKIGVWYSNGSFHLGGEEWHDLSDSFNIKRSGSGVTVTDGEVTYSFPTPQWCYVPNANGDFAFYFEGVGIVKNESYPLSSIGGGFAGVYTYNNYTNNEQIDLIMTPDYGNNGRLYGTTWNKVTAADNDPFTVAVSPMPLATVNVPTPTYTDGDWGYDLTTTGGVTKAIIVSYSGAGGNVTVPAIVGGYDVYQVGKGGVTEGVFSESVPVVDLTIADGIEIIGDWAFYYCRSTTTAGATPTVFGTLTIPDSVTSIGENAFNSCSSFDGQLVIPDSVTSIGEGAFRSCIRFTSVTLPESLARIENNAFVQCIGLTSLPEIPDSVTSIGEGAFANCTGAMGPLVIPDSVTSIGVQAFYNCNKITSLSIPDSVTSIGHRAFELCSSLTGRLIIPSSVTFLDYDAFKGCSGIDTLIICSDVTPGSSAFDMGGLTEVLDLSDTVDYSVDRYGIPDSAVVESEIQGKGFIGNTHYKVTESKNGTVYVLLRLIPLIFLIGLAVFFIRKVNNHNDIDEGWRK